MGLSSSPHLGTSIKRIFPPPRLLLPCPLFPLIAIFPHPVRSDSLASRPCARKRAPRAIVSLSKRCGGFFPSPPLAPFFLSVTQPFSPSKRRLMSAGVGPLCVLSLLGALFPTYFPRAPVLQMGSPRFSLDDNVLSSFSFRILTL